MNKKQEKYTRWVKIISIAIPVVVALLFGVRISSVEPLTFLPPIYATINAITAVVLVSAVIAVKKKKIIWHERLIKTALLLSALFLVLYVAYHMTSDSTHYAGNYPAIYYFVLITHIILSVAITPLILITALKGYFREVERHKKIARITFPLWLYVAISGVVVYLMISPFYK